MLCTCAAQQASACMHTCMHACHQQHTQLANGRCVQRSLMPLHLAHDPCHPIMWPAATAGHCFCIQVHATAAHRTLLYCCTAEGASQQVTAPPASAGKATRPLGSMAGLICMTERSAFKGTLAVMCVPCPALCTHTRTAPAHGHHVTQLRPMATT
jgi:hypothetical protein